MKSDNNRDKLGLFKSLIILNMLQKPNFFININKTSKKNSINVKNKNFNRLNLKKSTKDKMNTELILPIQQVNIENDSKLILPIQQVNIEGVSKAILPVCDKLSMEKFLIILKLLQQSDYNEKINKKLKDNSIDIKNVIQKKSSVIRNAKDKLNTKYILPLQDVVIKDDTECINKKGSIINTTNAIYKIPENINTDHFVDLISTLPIIIAEKDIDIPIESTFRLKNAALDIKNMKKDVYLTSSKLLPMYEKDDVFPSLNGKLFLEGFVRNKLDFSIAKDANDSIINLDTECVIIYIPFKCTTIIHYKFPPVFSKEKSLDYIPIYISSNCININNDFKEYLSEKKTQCSEFINSDTSPVNCEIEQAKIYETYTLVDKKPFSKDFPLEMDFHTIKENIIINLSLTLIQKQAVAINHRKNSK